MMGDIQQELREQLEKTRAMQQMQPGVPYVNVYGRLIGCWIAGATLYVDDVKVLHGAGAHLIPESATFMVKRDIFCGNFSAAFERPNEETPEIHHDLHARPTLRDELAMLAAEKLMPTSEHIAQLDNDQAVTFCLQANANACYTFADCMLKARAVNWLED